jgi:predicted AAA+ superfamily ATPase
MQDYLTVVDAYFSGIDVDASDLHQAASEFAAMRGVHSGRTAKQFFNQYKIESR